MYCTTLKIAWVSFGFDMQRWYEGSRNTRINEHSILPRLVQSNASYWCFQPALLPIEAHLPDLVLLDIHMPVMNGFEVFKWMRARQESQDIAVIFLSACMESDVRVNGLKMGTVDYITKPCACEEVLARVRIRMELRH